MATYGEVGLRARKLWGEDMDVIGGAEQLAKFGN